MIDQFILAILTAFLVGSTAAILGSLMVTKRMALVSGPLGHLALPGVAIALLYHLNIFLGALLSISLGAIFIWFLGLRARVHTEVLVGIIFAFFVALGFLFLPLKDAEEALIGNVFKTNILDLVLALLVFLIVLFSLRRIYGKLILFGISEEMAKAEGINVKMYNFLYLSLIALVCALEVKIVGTLLTVALTVIPAAGATGFARNLSSYFYLSLLFGGAGAILGTLLGYYLHLPVGPLIISVLFMIFLFSLLFKKS